MRLTRAAEYAIRCVLYLSRQKDKKIISRNEIAEAMEIPRDFLTKIAQQLSRANIIEIVQGAKGGFRLIEAPKNISLLDVIEAIIGEIFFNDCALRPHTCSHSCSCAVHVVWVKARNQFRETLNQATFDQLIKDRDSHSRMLKPAAY